MYTLLMVFHGLALGGLVLSVAVHVGALLGVPWPEEVMFLHAGIFVVFLPTVLVMQKVASGVPQKDMWKVALRYCPDWARKGLYSLFGYAFVNFAIFMFGSAEDRFLAQVRGFSGHWMFFYAASAATLYSAAEGWGRDRARKCPQGHAVSAVARFCETCGAAIQEA